MLGDPMKVLVEAGTYSTTIPGTLVDWAINLKEG
jgi:hypothetical protein